MFKGYIPTKGKKPLEEYKGRKEFYTHQWARKNFKEYAGILNNDLIQIDIDDTKQAEKLYEIIKTLDIKCHMIKTDRGRHFYFINPGIKNRKQGVYNALGLKCDIGLGSQNAVIPIKIGDKTRTVRQVDEPDVLPVWLYPISKKFSIDFSNMEEGDGRNETLFTYILTLQQQGMTKNEIRDVIRIINRFILKDPVSDKELEIILRDEAFLKETFYVKNKLQYEKLALYLIREHYVVKINDNLHIYKNGYYTSNTDEIERKMLQYIVNSNRANRSEVLRYLELRAPSVRMETPTLVAFENGVFNLETKELMEFSPTYKIKNKIPVVYNPGAYSEVMDKTLDKICCNDKKLRLLIEEMIGYTLFRRNELGKCFILTGFGANGKSTLLDVIKRLVGKENISSVALNELNDRFKTFQLEGKLVNIGDDISNGYIEDNSTFKKLVTGETVNVERKGKDPFDFENYSKLIFSCNEMPRINDLSDGLKRRLIFIPFNAKFSKKDADYDPFIIDKLMTDEALEYLLQLALKGLERVLYNREFTSSEAVEETWKEYEKRNNPIVQFMEEAKIENESTKDVYLQYQTYCNENGLKYLSRIAFSREICRNGYITKQVRVNRKKISMFIRE